MDVRPILWKLFPRVGAFLLGAPKPSVRPGRVVTVARRSAGGWSFSWSVGRAPYSIYLDGVLLDVVEDEAYECVLPGYDEEAPALEIVSDGDVAESLRYPPFVKLRWRGLQTADAYLVEQYVSGSWTTRVKVKESRRGDYSWASQPQTDGAATEWRVSALDQKGNAGTPISFSFTIVRNPPPPAISLAISGGNLVVSAG